MNAPSPLAAAVAERLRKWRRREEADDGALIHGVSAIANGLGDKPAVRAALAFLYHHGRVERIDCTNGVYWRAARPDTILVRPSDQADREALAAPEEATRAAFERGVRKAWERRGGDYSSPAPLNRGPSGHYVSPWVQEQYGHFRAGWLAGYATGRRA